MRRLLKEPVWLSTQRPVQQLARETARGKAQEHRLQREETGPAAVEERPVAAKVLLAELESRGRAKQHSEHEAVGAQKASLGTESKLALDERETAPHSLGKEKRLESAGECFQERKPYETSLAAEQQWNPCLKLRTHMRIKAHTDKADGNIPGVEGRIGIGDGEADGNACENEGVIEVGRRGLDAITCSDVGRWNRPGEGV